ncbi:MAG TPA: hypothetical protein PLH64_00415 [Anaerolineaceae bacterium]|nr:hypothetical protein [Anaerolineaceae bacterium]
MAVRGIGWEQLAVEITLLPLFLAECCPFAFAANFSQKPLLQDGDAGTLAELGKGFRLFRVESFTTEKQNSLIKKRNLSFIVANFIPVMRASLAKCVATGCELDQLVGLSQKSRHTL